MKKITILTFILVLFVSGSTFALTGSKLPPREVSTSVFDLIVAFFTPSKSSDISE